MLADTAFSLSDAAEKTGKELELSEQEQKTIAGPGSDETTEISKQQLSTATHETGAVVADEALKVTKDAVSSVQRNVKGDQGETLLYRLKQAILNLRQRTDYSDSVSTISKLIQRYAITYSKAGEALISTAEDDINTNPALDKAIRNFWELLSSFGDRKAWEQLEQKYKQLMTHAQSDPQFEKFMKEIGNAFQSMLMDPDFFDHAQEKIDELREKSLKLGNESKFRDDFEQLLSQAQVTINSLIEDDYVNGLIRATRRIYTTLSPPDRITNPDLLTDSMNIFLPLLIRSIQYLPNSSPGSICPGNGLTP